MLFNCRFVILVLIVCGCCRCQGLRVASKSCFYHSIPYAHLIVAALPIQ